MIFFGKIEYHKVRKFINTDSQRNILFPCDYHTSRFSNEHIPFHALKFKFVNDYNVTMKYLNEEYGSSKVDYKMYHTNLLRNDEYIDNYQKFIVISMLDYLTTF